MFLQCHACSRPAFLSTGTCAYVQAHKSTAQSKFLLLALHSFEHSILSHISTSHPAMLIKALCLHSCGDKRLYQYWLRLRSIPAVSLSVSLLLTIKFAQDYFQHPQRSCILLWLCCVLFDVRWICASLQYTTTLFDTTIKALYQTQLRLGRNSCLFKEISLVCSIEFPLQLIGSYN